MQNVSKYPKPMVALHWIMAIVILGMIACGWYMAELEGEDPLRPVLYDLHKSFGVTALVLVLFRIVLRFSSEKPSLPESFSKLEIKAANAGHVLLYVLMVAVPLSGYAMSTLFGFPVKWFGLELP